MISRNTPRDRHQMTTRPTTLISYFFISLIQLARSAKNLVEEQRALATIGRTWFVYLGSVTDPEEVEESQLEAQSAYLKSLSVCDKLRDSVPEKELLEMRSRLYLNLGLIYESKDDQARAHSFMEKALFIARCVPMTLYLQLDFIESKSP